MPLPKHWKPISEYNKDYFQARVAYWAEKLIPDWNVGIRVKKLNEDSIAQCECTREELTAIITLNGFQAEDLAEKDYDLTAFHEVLHVVCDDILEHLETNYNVDITGRLIHTLIHRLEKVL